MERKVTARKRRAAVADWIEKSAVRDLKKIPGCGTWNVHSKQSLISYLRDGYQGSRNQVRLEGLFVGEAAVLATACNALGFKWST